MVQSKSLVYISALPEASVLEPVQLPHCISRPNYKRERFEPSFKAGFRFSKLFQSSNEDSTSGSKALIFASSYTRAFAILINIAVHQYNQATCYP